MRKVIVCAVSIVAVLIFASVAMAANATADGEIARVVLDSGALGLVCAGVAIGMGAACGGGGAGMGAAIAGTCVAIVRNPEMGKRVFVILFLGLALIESLVIYTLVISLLLLYSNPFMG